MVTLIEAKQFLDITGNTKDSWVNMLIKSSKNMIERFIGVQLTYEEDTPKYLDGTGFNYVELPGPLTNLSYLTINGVSYSTVNFDYDDFYLETKDGTIFPKGSNNIIAIGDWGYKAWPDDLKLAQLQLIAWLYQMDKNEIAVENKTIEGQVTSFVKHIPLPITMILRDYSKRVL